MPRTKVKAPMSSPLISIISPVYYGEKMVAELVRRTKENLSPITDDFEIILVNDASPDNSWDEIRKQCISDVRVKGLDLSRNFGQACAIAAGIEVCRGDWVVVMDCDLQDPPEAIPRLYEKAQEGYEVVFSRRNNRKDSAMTLALSRFFYHVFSYFVDHRVDSGIGNFSIASKRVIENFRKLHEHCRAYQMFISWLGFRQACIDIESQARHSGSSSYTFGKKIRFALALILAHSNKPLYLTLKTGLAMASFAAVAMVALVVAKLSGYDFLSGWTSLIVSIYLVGGMLMASMGVVGIYVGNIYIETKNRPIFITREEINIGTGIKRNPNA